MTTLLHTRAERVWLKKHPVLNEKWLQDIVADDPSILGMGDLGLVERERRQEHAGRLDLLLADDKDETRYEVELMLGATDESHIIRCIEYWDIERRRYPAYEHIAVLVAEDITSRFLNVLSLFAGNIPLVVLQLNALSVEDKIILDFVKVLDQRQLRSDDTSVVDPPATREYWESKSQPNLMVLVDKLLELVNLKSESTWSLNYNKTNVSLSEGKRRNRFVFFKPRKKDLRLRADVKDVVEWIKRFEEIGIQADEKHGKRVWIAITPSLFKENREIITEFVETAVAEMEG